MSLRWLQDDYKPSYKSRSRSSSRSSSPDDKRQKVDEFGRTIPSKLKSSSRSRSRSKGRSRLDNWQDSGYSRPRGYSDRGSKEKGKFHKKRDNSSSSSSSSGSSDSNTPATRLVASNKPKYLNARLFVANIVSNEITKEELTQHFEKYGNVVDVLVHHKNYAFIQYLKEEHARLAVEGEQGSTLKGWRLDVKMATEGRRGGPGGRGGGGDRGGRGGRGGGGRFNAPDRDRSPLGGEPFRGGRRRSPGPFPPPVGDFGMPVRDPYFPDPYRRPFPDPWHPHDDPYRRDPYLDPYRDPYALRPPPPIVIECEIFMVNPQLRAYAEAIELRVREQNIITAVSIIPEGRTSAQMVEELTARDGLFAIFVNPQNEQHRSLTLNILHGVPQEHRNMPLDDAIVLVGRSFEKYVEGLREKAKAAAVPLVPPVSRVFLPASAEVAYLLNLLADNRALTIDELNTVIKYLQERRDKLIDAESRPIVTDDGLIKVVPSQSTNPVAGGSNESISVQQDIKNKIMSIFTSAGGSIQGVPPANGSNQFPIGTPAPAPPPPPPAPATSSASLINFDNPNVQKALDNLIQSSPSLLKNFTSKVSAASSQMGVSSVTSSLAPSVSSSGTSGGFGQGNQMIPNMMPQSNQLQGGGIRMPGGYLDMQGQRMPKKEESSMNVPPQGGYNMQGTSQTMPRY